MQQRRYSNGCYIIISPSPRSHLTDEVCLAVGGQSVRRSWLMGRLPARRWWGGPAAAAAARGWSDKIGSYPSLLQPPCQIQINLSGYSELGGDNYLLQTGLQSYA